MKSISCSDKPLHSFVFILIQFASFYLFLLQVVGIDQKDALKFIDLGFADNKISAC